MTQLIDKKHFQELSEKEPSDVCKRAACRYSQEENRYAITIWGETMEIYPQNCRIKLPNTHQNELDEAISLFTILYLLNAQETEITGTWISEKDIPGGPTFFRGPHQIPSDIVTKKINNNLNMFRTICETLGGTPIHLADAAYRFEITDRIPVAVLYWQGDEDFPAEMKILYDETIMKHLAADAVYALAVGICKRLRHQIAMS